MASHQGVLVPIPYLPRVSWFVKLWSNPSVCWDLGEITDKRRPRNRCTIATAQGAQTLSIPLQGGRNQRVKLSGVKPVDHDKWRREHMHAMQTAYGKSPYFVHYSDELFDVLTKSQESLAQLNLALIEHLIKTLRVEVEIVEQRDNVESTEDDIDSSALRYPQVFENTAGFVPNCSVVDLLFNCGPDSANFIRSMRR